MIEGIDLTTVGFCRLVLVRKVLRGNSRGGMRGGGLLGGGGWFSRMGVILGRLRLHLLLRGGIGGDAEDCVRWDEGRVFRKPRSTEGLGSLLVQRELKYSS